MYVVIYLISIKFVDVVFWLLVRMLYYGATENSWKPDSSELPLSLTENELFSEYESVSKNIFLFHWQGWKFTVTFLTKTMLFIPMVPDITGGLTRSRISLSKTRNKNLTKGSSCALDRFTMLFVNRVSRFPSVLRLGEDVTRPSIWWQVFINLWMCRS